MRTIVSILIMKKTDRKLDQKPAAMNATALDVHNVTAF